MFAQYLGDSCGCAVTCSKPNDFRGIPKTHTAVKEIRIFSNDHEVVYACIVPDYIIVVHRQTDKAYMV